MGHEVGVTPLQMTVAMAAIANGGKLVTPRIVKSVTTADGRTVSNFSPTVLRQVIDPETARAGQHRACAEWLAIAAPRPARRSPGFTICGKTGTAQKVDPKGGYEQGKYVVSFSGYMPAEHPEFVALVVLDDAKTTRPNKITAAPSPGPSLRASLKKRRAISTLSRMRKSGKRSRRDKSP